MKDICKVIKLWRERQLQLEENITKFKSLAISKLVYLALITLVSNNVIKELKKYKKNLWGNERSKINLDTS